MAAALRRMVDCLTASTRTAPKQKIAVHIRHLLGGGYIDATILGRCWHVRLSQ